MYENQGYEPGEKQSFLWNFLSEITAKNDSFMMLQRH